MFFFSRRDPRKLVLILEMQSSLIRCSAALFEAGKQPSIIASQSAELSYKPNASSAFYVRTALSRLKETADAVIRSLYLTLEGDQSLPKRVSEAHYVLSSPWILSQAKTISVAFDRDTAVTEERVRSIIAEERDRTSMGGEGAEIIEEKIFDVKLNGYSLATWAGKAAKEVEVAYALSLGSSDSISRLQEAIGHIVKPKEAFFHSSLLLQYISLRDAKAPGDAYMLVHAHGELTDVVVVRGGRCSFFGSYPIGIRSIIRRIAESERSDLKTAESLLSLYLGGHMDDASSRRAGQTVERASRMWSEGLDKLLEAGMPGKSAPQSVFVIAHSHADFFERSISASRRGAKIGKLAVDMPGTYASAIHSMQE